jgi:hypothetical protein
LRLKYFVEDPGWRQLESGMKKSRDPGSGINIPDTQHNTKIKTYNSIYYISHVYEGKSPPLAYKEG